MKLTWPIIFLIIIGATTMETQEVNDEEEEGGHQVSIPTKTKTVYGFLDFTTTVSDTLMVFKPSKAPGKGRNVGGATRSASVLRSKSAGKNRSANKNVEKQIESSPPERLEVSTTPATLEDVPAEELESSGRSVRRGKPIIRPRPGGEVAIEGSLIHLDDPTTTSTPVKQTSTERLKANRRQPDGEVRGTGSIVSSFPLMHSHVAVSSRVDVRIGGLSKVNGKGTSVPKQVEVRTEMKLAPETEQIEPERKMPSGQSLVSKTVGTRVQDGMTTIHETSVIGTTIDGQYAHFVQSTSRIFQEPSVTPHGSIPGSVEVVTDLPVSVGVSGEQKKENAIIAPTSGDEEANMDSLPSLESLFKSVQEDEGLPAPEQLIPRKKPQSAPLEDEAPAAVVLKPSFRVPASTSQSTPNNVERRTGLASASRFSGSANGATSPRPRTEDQRWRYSPSAKPKVAIQRTGGAAGRQRATTPSPQYESDSEEGEQQSPPAPQPAPEPEIDPTEVITLRVHTVTPEGYSNIYYEVATIKSPYIMRLGAIRNTRYVTLTRSFTRLFTTTPAPLGSHYQTAKPGLEDLPEPDPEILLDPSQPLPDPENILATTAPYENILKDSSDTATLPAIIVAATESGGEEAFSLQTVTETFSTTELSMKTSVLPYLKAGETSFMTLTQSYFVTRVVVAVKTVPPQDLYQFIPSKTLTDIATNLQEAGSEHVHERLLPGELEYSENDEFSDDEDDAHRHEKRVPAPDDYPQDSDLSSVGQDFDPSQVGRPYVELEPSLVDTAAENTKHAGSTPPLPSGGFQLEPSINANPLQQFPQQLGQDGTPVLTPEQLQQLALFRFMNPYAAAGLPFGYPGFGGPGAGGVQVIQTSRPVVKTADIIKTETVSIWDGAKTIYSTLTRTKGTTVVTETEYGTTTIPAPVNPLFAQQQFTVVSSPVVTEITTTSTELRIYRIIFRAQTTYTTVTSTTVFPTVVTTYVSSTIPIQPTAFPQGLFPGSYPFPAFG